MKEKALSGKQEAFFLVVSLLMGVPPGCAPTVPGANPGNPALPDTSPQMIASAPHLSAAAFGYLHFSVGAAGMPGNNDIRPGFAFSLTAPPQGVLAFLTMAGIAQALSCASGGAASSGLDGLWGTLLLGEQGWNHFPELPAGITGTGIDLTFALSTGQDLSCGGRVTTSGIGVGGRFFGGCRYGVRLHALAGLEWRYIVFENRSNEGCLGPYLGVTLEYVNSYDWAVNTTLRYNWLDRSLPGYDIWEFTIGFSKYW